MKYLIILLFTGLFLSACSSSEEITKKEITSDLSSEVIVSQSTKLTVNLPSGWTNILDNTETVFDIWLVSPEKNAVISFIPISINKDIEIDDDENAIELLTKFSKESKKSNGSDLLSSDEITIEEINEFSASRLNYELEGKIFNSIIFGKDKVYYECLAYFKDEYESTEDELEKLFALQKLVIETAQLKSL